MNPPDKTLRDGGADATLREQTGGACVSGEARVPGEGFSPFLGPKVFRGWPVLEQLPTGGAEADIYLVQAGTERCALKLYRHRLEPKIEVLTRVSEISRANPRHFVVFREAGFDESTGRWYELQEYIPAGSLRELPPEAVRKPGFVRSLVSGLAEAIHCLHRNGIVHCDIKPANVLARSLEPPELVLTDFGISSLLASDMSHKMTSLKGTPMYWAPEAFSRAVGRPCDWWGLGMIVLELLTGGHPFRGLTDSQIIRELTLRGVGIPDALDPRWAHLLRGLLTRDDRHRWGHGQVARWLAGERGVPVHHETPAPASGGDRTPYHLGSGDYFTAEELALALAGNPNPWFAGMKLPRDIRQWLENNMMFDEAVKLGDDIAAADPERAIFRFVHKNARCPFCVLGKTIDFGGLSELAHRVAQRAAGPAEARVVEMLRNGQLLSFYGEYAAMTGNAADPLFDGLLRLMEKKPLHEQLGYFEALSDPAAFLWPDAPPGNREEALSALARLGAVPLKRADFEELRQRYVLPGELLDGLRFASGYAKSAEGLHIRQARRLLLPREPGMPLYGLDELSLADYDRTALARLWGHSADLLEKLRLVRSGFADFALAENLLWRDIFSRAAARLDDLKHRKATPADSAFLTKAAALFEARRKIVRARAARFFASAAAGGSGLCLARFLFGESVNVYLMAGVFLFLLGFSLYSDFRFATAFSRDTSFGRYLAEPLPTARAVGGAVIFFGGMISLGLFTTYSYAAAFALGAVLGGVAYYVTDRRALLRNAEAILDASGAYCAPEARDYFSAPLC